LLEAEERGKLSKILLLKNTGGEGLGMMIRGGAKGFLIKKIRKLRERGKQKLLDGTRALSAALRGVDPFCFFYNNRGSWNSDSRLSILYK